MGLTIFTKILNGLRYLESWICDIVSCISSITMWGIIIFSSISTGFNFTELPVILTLLAILSNSIFAYIMWKIMYRKVVIDGGGDIYKKRNLNIKKIIKLKKQYQKLYWNKEVDERKK